jgi:hypothetical protein
MSETLVKVGECRCPGAPHPEDWVELHPQATFPMGTAVMAAIRAAGEDNITLQGLMGQAYVLFGIKAWSFVGPDGDPIPVNHTTREWPQLVVSLLPWAHGGAELVDAADDLYSEDILRPLMGRTSKQSQAGQMDGSTSATQHTSQPLRERSQPSLPPDTDGTPSGGQDS